MHITREGDYAVRVVVALAAAPEASIVRTEDLSETTGVPRPYLKKIVQALCRAHLVETRQGQGGGVWLRRDPATITLRQMIEAIEGPILVNRCLARAGACPRDNFCPVHPVWRRIQAVLVGELDAVSATDLAGRRPSSRAAAAGRPRPEIGAARPRTARRAWPTAARQVATGPRGE